MFACAQKQLQVLMKPLSNTDLERSLELLNLQTIVIVWDSIQPRSKSFDIDIDMLILGLYLSRLTMSVEWLRRVEINVDSHQSIKDLTSANYLEVSKFCDIRICSAIPSAMSWVDFLFCCLQVYLTTLLAEVNIDKNRYGLYCPS
jgi:hypothetical protein